MTAASPRRRRALGARITVAAALAVTVWSVTGLPPSDAAEPARDAEREQVIVVAEGDTLWGLAADHVPAGGDRHGWVADVAERNGVDPRGLRPGQVVRVPSG